MRFLVNRPLNLSHTFYEDDEETPLTVSSVTVTLSDWQGAVIASSPATDGGSGNWTVSFPAQPLGNYTAAWDTGSQVDSDSLEVVGGFLFSVPQARKSDDYLADQVAFPASEIIEYREVVENEFEKITGRSFTTRIAERTFTGVSGAQDFIALIPDAQSLEAVWVNGLEVTDLTGWTVNRLGVVSAPDLAVYDGDAVTVRVRYGFANPPRDVARAGMIRLRSLLASEDSGIPDRATTWQPQEGGTFRLATAGQGKWRTGIPEVDSTLRDYALDSVMAVFAIG
jgi:hypothetical protein